MAKIGSSLTPENDTESTITWLPLKEMESWTQVSIVQKVVIIFNYKVCPPPQEECTVHQFSSISFDHLKSILKNFLFPTMYLFKTAGNILTTEFATFW